MAALRRDLTAVFAAPVTSHARWSVSVRSLDTGESLFALDAGKLMMPASNMKIVTLAAAAHLLGWDARFSTTLEATGTIRDGVLHGDLIVRGGGDPTINERDGRGAAVFAAWAEALRASGIAEVHGGVIGDDGRFDDEGLGAGWAWDYLQYGYAAPVGALQYNENAARLTVLPGAAPREPAVLWLSPGSGLTLWNRATTAPANAAETIDYRRHLDRPVLEVTGGVPLAPPPDASPAPARTVVRAVAVVNPTVFFVQSLKDALMSAGIRVSGEAVDLDDVAGTLPPHAPGEAPERRVVATSESPPLRDIAVPLMRGSQNQYAETLLKAMGAASGGLGTAEAGRAAVLAALRAWGLDEASLVMADGSGLSRYNYATADLLTSILDRMHRDPAHRDAFAASLPVAGRDGTVAARLRGTRAEGNAAAKTGSISNVRALSGYVRTRDGELLAFSILANHFVIPSATINWITDLAVEILANFSRESGGRPRAADRVRQ